MTALQNAAGLPGTGSVAYVSQLGVKFPVQMKDSKATAETSNDWFRSRLLARPRGVVYGGHPSPVAQPRFRPAGEQHPLMLGVSDAIRGERTDSKPICLRNQIRSTSMIHGQSAKECDRTVANVRGGFKGGGRGAALPLRKVWPPVTLTGPM